MINRLLNPQTWQPVRDLFTAKKPRTILSKIARAEQAEPLEVRVAPATLTWVGDLDANWNSGTSGVDTNWDSNTLPVSGDTLIFAGAAIGSLNNDTTGGNQYILQFTAGGYTLTGNSIDLGLSGDDITSSTGTNVIGLNLSLSGTNPEVHVGSGLVSITGNLSGGSEFWKDGAGTVALSGTNTHTNSNVVVSGTLEISDFAQLGSGNLYLGQGGTDGTIKYTGGSTSTSKIGAFALQAAGTGNTIEVTNAAATLSLTAALGNTGAGKGYTKTGAGTLAITVDVTHDGPVTVSAGSLVVGNGATAGSLTSSGSAAVTVDGGLTVNRSDTFSINNNITGTGTLTQAGSGTTVLTGSNSYTGTTTISSGTLQIGNGGTAGTLGTGSVVDNASLVFNRSDAVTVSNAISGTGTVTKNNTNTTTFTGANTYTGTTFLNDGTLQLGAGGTSGSAGTGTINLTGTLALNRSDAPTFSNPVAMQTGANRFVDVASGTTATLSGQITGSTEFWKSGTGTLVLSNATNAQSNSNVIVAGTVQIADFAAFGTGNVFIGQGGGVTTLKYTGASASTAKIGAFALQGTGTNSTIEVTNSATTLTLTAALGNSAAGRGLTKTGPGTLAISGASTYDGDTAINAGILLANNNAALGGGSGVTTVAVGAELNIGSGITVTGETVTILGTGTNFGGALRTPTGTGTWAGPVIIGDGASRVGAGAAATLNISGGIQGSGANQSIFITGDSGTGVVIFSAASGTNNYTGTTNIIRGILRLGANNSLPVGNVLDVDTSSAAEIARFDLFGFNQTVSALQRTNTGGGAGGSDVTNSGAAATFTVNQTANTTYSGTVSGALALVKSGTGTLALSVANTYTGGTTINAGVLSTSSATGLGTGAVSIPAAGTLTLNSASATTSYVINGISGSGIINVANLLTGTNTVTIAPSSGNLNSFAGTINIGVGAATGAGKFAINAASQMPAAGATVNVLTNATLYITGAFTLPSSVTLAGGDTGETLGQLRIDSGATVSGGVTIAGSITGAGDSLIGSGAGVGTISGVISESGGSQNLSKGGSGTVLLSNANTYTGTTSVSAGVLAISNATALGTTAGATTVATGAALEISGGINVAEPITINSGGISNAGAIRSTSGSNTLSGLITLASQARINADAGTLTLDVASGNAVTSTNLTLVTGGAGSIVINDPLSLGTGGILQDGAGSTTISSGVANAYTGATTVRQGTLNYNGTLAAGGALIVGDTASTKATLNIASSGTISVTTVAVGTNATATGAIYHSAGTLAVTQAAATTNFQLGAVASGYGYYNLSGGNLNVNEMGIGGNFNDTRGVFDMTGGTLTNTGWLTIGRGGATSSGVLNYLGGTISLTGAVAGSKIALKNGGTAGATAVLNIGTGMTLAGPASTSYSLDLAFGGNTAGTFGIANVASGATLAIGGIIGTVANPTTRLYVDGGTVRPTIANSTFGTDAEFDNYIIGSGGMTFDNNGLAVTTSRAVINNAGDGVVAPSIAAGGTGYIGAPLVQITGGGGTGATGYATVSGGAITGIVITNPGTGYTSAPTFTVVGGGGTGASFTAGANVANPTTGALTYTGTSAGNITNSSTSTYAGQTNINAGTVTAGANGLFGATSAKTVIASGATLNVNGNRNFGAEPFEVSGAGVGGNGAIINSGAAAQNAFQNIKLLANATFGGGANTGRFDIRGGIATLDLGGFTLTKNGASDIGVVGAAGTGVITDGNIIVNAGRMWSEGTTVVSTGTGNITVNTGGTWGFYAQTGAFSRPIVLNAGSTLSDIGSPTLDTVASDISVTGAATINATGAGGLLLNGIISGAGSITKNGAGAGVVTLAGINTYTGTTSITAGTLAIAADSGLGTAPGAATPGHLTINGGTLATTATFTLDANRGIYLGDAAVSANGTFNTALGTTLTYNGIIADNPGAGADNLVKAGTGTMILGGLNTYTGTTTINAGTLSIASDSNLGTAPGAPTNNIFFGGGTLAITANQTLNTNRSISVAAGGGTLDTATGTTTSYAGAVTGTGALNKTGAGTLIYTGTLNLPQFHPRGGTTTLDTGASVTATVYSSIGISAGETATLNVQNGAQYIVTGDLNVSDLTGSTGTLNISGATTLVQALTLYVGKTGTAVGTVNQSGGTLSQTAAGGGDWRIGGNAGGSGASVGTYNLTGGSFSTLNNLQIGAFGQGTFSQTGTGTTATVSGYTAVGRFAGSVGALSISAGTFTSIGQPVIIAGEEGTGTITTSGSGELVGNTLALAYSTGGVGTVNLNGGTIGVGAVQKGTGTTANINFDDGTLKALVSNANFLSGLDSALVKAGGGTIDTNTFDIGIAQALAHDPALGASPDGGITKTSTGTLTLSGTSSYTGATALNAGTLALTGTLSGTASVAVNNTANLIGTGTINAASSTTVNTGGTVSPGTIGTTGTLTLGALTFNGGTYAADIVGAAADKIAAAGTVNLNGGSSGSFTLNNAAAGVAPSTVFTFIENTSGFSIANTPLTGAAEAGTVTLDSQTATYSYLGGAGGDDFTATVSGAVSIAGTAAADSFEVRRLTGGGSDLLQTLRGGSIVDSRPIASVPSLTIDADDNNDNLFINYGASGGFYDVPITYIGNNQAGSPGDTITIGGTTVTTVTHTFLNNSDGSIAVLNGTTHTISYTGLEPIIDNLNATNRVFDFTGGAETITLTQSGADTIIDSTLGESVTFAAPTGSLTVNTGTGDDIVTVTSLGGTWSGVAVTFDGQASTDSIDLSAALPAFGSLTVSAEQITLGSHTTTGTQSYTGNVTLASDTTLTTTNSNVTFTGTIDSLVAGGQSLTVSVGTAAVAFGGAIGSTDEINNLTVTAGAAALVLPATTAIGTVNITTAGGALSQTGALIAGDATTLTTGAASITLTNAGNDFQNTVTATNTGANNIQITDGVGTLTTDLITSGSGDITINATAGSLTISDAVTTTGNVTYTTGGSVIYGAGTTTANRLTITATGGIGLLGDELDVAIAELVTTTGGAQFILGTGSNLTAINVNAGTADVDLNFASIADTDGATDITAGDLTLQLAATGGTLANPLHTSVDTVLAITGGSLFLRESSGISGLDVNTGTADFVLTLVAGGITDTDGATDITAANATLTNLSPGSAIGTVVNPIATAVDGLTTFNQGANQYIEEDNGLTSLNLASIAGDIELELIAGTVTDADGTRDIEADDLTIIAPGDVGTSLNGIRTLVNTITVNTAAGNADQYLIEENGLTALSLNAGTGDITLDLLAGNLTDADALTDITAATALVSLSAAGQTIGTIGSRIETQVDDLTTTTANGDQYIEEVDGLTSFAINAGTGSLDLLLAAGSLLDTDAAADITATSTTLTLTGGGEAIGTLANPIQISTDTLTSKTVNGDQFLAEANGLTAVNLDAGTGDALLQIVTGSLADADADVDFVAAALTLTLNASGQAIGTSINRIRTDVDSLTATTTNANQYFTEDDGLTALDINSGTGDIFLTLTAGGILNSDGDVDLEGNEATITLSAAGEDANLDTTLNSLNATLNNGDLTASETAGLTQINVNVGTGAADLTLITGNLLDSDVSTDITAATIAITTTDGTGGSIGALANHIRTSADAISIVASGTGEVFITETNGSTIEVTAVTGDVTLNTLTGDWTLVNGGVFTAGDVNLTATAGDLLRTGALAVVTGSTVSLVAGGADGDIGTLADALLTDAAVLTFTATGTGNVYLDEANDTFLSGTTGAGNTAVTIASLGGDITLNSIAAVAAASTVTINATGAILDGNGASTNITALAAILSSGDGVGTGANGLETAVTNIEGDGGTGGYHIIDADSVTVGGAGLGTGIVSNGGDIIIEALTNITVTETIDNDAGNIALYANNGLLSIQSNIQTADEIALYAATTVTESGAGALQLGNAVVTSGGAITLEGSNTLVGFSASNSGSGNISLDNAGVLTIEAAGVLNPNGGTVTIDNTGDLTVDGPINSGTHPGTPGGDITVISSTQLTVNAVVSSRGGTGGTFSIIDAVTLNATPLIGQGDIVLQGGAGSIIINSPLAFATSFTLAATDDVIIGASVTTTGLTSDLTVTGDRENDGIGGVIIQTAGSLTAGNELYLRGSDLLSGSVNDDAITIESDATNTQISARKDIHFNVQTGGAPEGSVFVGGKITTSSNGDLFFNIPVVISDGDADIGTIGGGDINFYSTLDAADPFDAIIRTEVGNIYFYGEVGGRAGYQQPQHLNITSAFNVEIHDAFTASQLSVNNPLGSTIVLNTAAVSLSSATTSLTLNSKTFTMGGDVALGAGDAVITVDNIDLGETDPAAISGTGDLTIRALTLGRSIGINGTGDLNISTAEIGNITSGFANITFGATTSTSDIAIGAVTFSDPVHFLTPATGGDIAVTGQITGTDDASFEFQARTLNFNVAALPTVQTDGGDITIGSATLAVVTSLAQDTTLITNNGGTSGDIYIRGTINGTAALVLDAADGGTGGLVTIEAAPGAAGGVSIGGSTPLDSLAIEADILDLRPQVRTTGNQTYEAITRHDFRSIKLDAGTTGDISFTGTGDILVHNAATIETGGSVTFGPNVDSGIAGNGALTIYAGAATGSVTFISDVGSVTELVKLDIARAASATLEGSVRVENTLRVNADEVDLLGAGTDIIQATAPNATITLQPISNIVALEVASTAGQSAGVFDITSDELDKIGSSFSLLTIGSATGTSTAGMTVHTYNFDLPVILRQHLIAGKMNTTGALTATAASSITLESGATTLGGNVEVVDGNITITNAIVENASLEISSDTGNITFHRPVRGGTASGNDLTVVAPAGDVLFNDSVGLGASTLGDFTTNVGGRTYFAKSVQAASINLTNATGWSETKSLFKATTGGINIASPLLLVGNTVLIAQNGGDITVNAGATSYKTTGGVKKYYSFKLQTTNTGGVAGDINFNGNFGDENLLVPVGGPADQGGLGAVSITSKDGNFIATGGSIVAKGFASQTKYFTSSADISSEFGTVSIGAKAKAPLPGDPDGVDLTGDVTAKTLKISTYTDLTLNSLFTVTGNARFNSVNKVITVDNAANTFGSVDLLGGDAALTESGDTDLRVVKLGGVFDLVSTGNVTNSVSFRAQVVNSITATGSVNIAKNVRVDLFLKDITAQTGIVFAAGYTGLTLAGDLITTTGDIILAADMGSSTGRFVNQGGTITATAGDWVIYSYAATGTVTTGLGLPTYTEFGIRYPDLPGAYGSGNGIVYFLV